MKVPMNISIEEEDAAVIRLFCEKTGITISRLYEAHTKGLVKAAKASGILEKTRAGRIDLMKFFVKGVAQDV